MRAVIQRVKCASVEVDGNIIGPKILGDSTGLSSFWVLFAIMFFLLIRQIGQELLLLPICVIQQDSRCAKAAYQLQE